MLAGFLCAVCMFCWCWAVVRLPVGTEQHACIVIVQFELCLHIQLQDICAGLHAHTVQNPTS
jgi:hypothetical protein